MGRTDAPTRRRGAGNRDALIRAGFEAIASLGYARATTAEICRRAGVSSGTFFHYFATKEELLLAMSRIYPRKSQPTDVDTTPPAPKDAVYRDGAPAPSHRGIVDDGDGDVESTVERSIARRALQD